MRQRRSALIHLHHRLHVFRNCTVVVLDMLPDSPAVKVCVSPAIDSGEWRESLLASVDAMHVVVKPSSVSDTAIYLGTLLPQSVKLVRNSEQSQYRWVLVGMLRCSQAFSDPTLDEHLQSET